MTDKKIVRIRIIIAVAAFIVLCGTLFPFFSNMSLKFHGFQGPIIYLTLVTISFVALANGVSFLSEIFQRHGNIIKILTGILSLFIFVFVLFPQDLQVDQILAWLILIGLVFSAILIPIFSLLEISHEPAIKKVYSFIFAIFSGIYSWVISSYVSRGYSNPDAGIGYMIYGLIIFAVSLIANLLAISHFHNEGRGES